MSPILLLVRTLSTQGEKILGARWLPFIDFLRSQLAGIGHEVSGSSDELFLYGFDDLTIAINGLHTTLTKGKEEYAWPPSSGSVPLQIIFDLSKPNNRYNDPNTWAPLEHETIYISTRMKDQWQRLLANTTVAMPDHQLPPLNAQFCALIFNEERQGKREKLLAYRALPVSGQGQECFYCGMVDHSPANCPARLLTMPVAGITELGYLPFAQINDLYKEVFPLDPGSVTALAHGTKKSDLRHNKKLLLLVAYLDVWAVFQPRFLWNIAFSSLRQWDEVRQASKLSMANRNLHMGLDCLRVGQYEQAEDLLHGESKKKDGDLFAANIALAFWSLEQNRNSDMGRYLTEARGLAHGTAEIIYVNLLLSRYYEQQKDFWNAKEAVHNALKVDYDCLDIQYRRLQLAVREGLSEREGKYLENLITGQQDFFIRVLLDPQLLPIQGLVEMLLQKQYQLMLADAHESFQAAEAEFAVLQIWLDKKDHQIKGNQASLEHLAKQIKRQSYYDLLDVSERSKGIFTVCNRLRRAKVEQLQNKLEKQQTHLNTYRKFWRSYPYKSFLKDFPTEVEEAVKKNATAGEYIQHGRAKDIHQGRKLIKELTKEMLKLGHLYDRLIMVHSLLRWGGFFARRLLICEGVLLAIVALFFPLMGIAAGTDPTMAWAADLAHNSALLKKSLLITGLFGAPGAALSWTMVGLQKK